MYRNYIKIGYRNLLRNKGFSVINIGGLSIGIAVALLIGLWIQEELDFDKSNKNYDRVAQVWQQMTYNGEIDSQEALPIPVLDELLGKFGDDFKHLAAASWRKRHILKRDEKKINRIGNYMGQDMPKILDLKMIQGNRDALSDLKALLISKSTANALFGDDDPMGEIIQIDGEYDLKVTGVYEDFPRNSSFHSLKFIANFEYFVSVRFWVRKAREEKKWHDNSYQVYAQISENANLNEVSQKIRNIKYDNVDNEDKEYAPVIFLHPMKDWHLRSNWENGVQTGGLIQYVWLFGIAACFVLLLACINFMNLSTAQSEKRAKEVGIRKSIGSRKSQLVSQFMIESFLVVFMSFVVAVGLFLLFLPFFNHLTDKEISISAANQYFWLMTLGFLIITGFLAGSYPAFYLSSFKAVNVLKGTFKRKTNNASFRQVLVVTQFTISIALIIGSLVVNEQVQFTKNRPMGYDTNDIIMLRTGSANFKEKFDLLRNELIKAQAIEEMCESSSPLTDVYSVNSGFIWAGKDPNLDEEFATINVSLEYGKTIDWKIVEGRDFSRNFSSDSTGFVLNKAAVDFMELEEPIEKNVKWNEINYHVIGVVDNLMMESPFESVRPTIYFLGKGRKNFMNLKLNPILSTSEAIARVQGVIEDVVPSVPFKYDFVDDEHAQKFIIEERLGNLSITFTFLAILISCIGLFGLAAFTASQRTKEIGIRKVLGASVLNLWKMLSGDFVKLVLISCVFAIPVAYYGTSAWLENYEYRTTLPLWIFISAGVGAIVITLLTVSFQAIRSARMNPVKSLRSE